MLDPFMGHGTTSVVAKKLERNFIVYEIDEKNFNIAKKRIETVQVINSIDYLKISHNAIQTKLVFKEDIKKVLEKLKNEARFF